MCLVGGVQSRGNGRRRILPDRRRNTARWSLPTLSNIYLHYVVDLWMEKIIKRDMQGYVELLRYCDDLVILVQCKNEAEKILKELEERLNKFGLDLSKEKTRLIEFGRYARINAEDKKPDTFDFLGFTHFCDRTRTI